MNINEDMTMPNYIRGIGTIHYNKLPKTKGKIMPSPLYNKKEKEKKEGKPVKKTAPKRSHRSEYNPMEENRREKSSR